MVKAKTTASAAVRGLKLTNHGGISNSHPARVPVESVRYESFLIWQGDGGPILLDKHERRIFDFVVYRFDDVLK